MKVKYPKLKELGEIVNNLQVELITKNEDLASMKATIIRLTTESEYAQEQSKANKREAGELGDQLQEMREENTILL
jgi:hypothetical protein